LNPEGFNITGLMTNVLVDVDNVTRVYPSNRNNRYVPPKPIMKLALPRNTERFASGPADCEGAELQIVFEETPDFWWSLEDNSTSITVMNSELAVLDEKDERVITTCASPTNCFDLHTTDGVQYEFFINNTRIYGPDIDDLIYFGYWSQKGVITLDRCSSIQELCDIDNDMSENQSISRSTLDHVLGVSGRKDVVYQFQNSFSAVHRVPCSVAAWSADKLTKCYFSIMVTERGIGHGQAVY
jgi:hypothetical protein